MLLPPPKEVLSKAFALEALNRLPLADAFYALWAYLAADDLLGDLFAQHRGRCYQDKLSFAEVVGVLADAVTRYHGSGRRAITKALERQRLSCRHRAVYGKLARLPLPLAEAFLSALTARLRPLFPAGLYRTELPRSLAGLAVIVLDGKKIKRAAKRLLATRGQPGRLYGGKILAAYLPADGLVAALAAHPDGEANDIRLVPRVLPLARAAVAGPRLWVADRQFGDLIQPGRLAEPGDHYLIRYSRVVSFTADPGRPALAGLDAAGRPFCQEWGWLGAEGDRRRQRYYVRRITLQRAGAEDVVVVTDLLDERACPAEDLLAVYLTRWQVENVFQAITEVFELRHLIGCAPGATIFQASLCLVIDNALQVLRGYAAQAAPEPMPVEALSAEQLFTDLHEELVSVHRTLTPEELLGSLRPPSNAEELRDRLGALLERAWTPAWRKVVNKKPRPHRPKAKRTGAHTSVHKILQQTKRQQDKTTPTRGP